MIRVLWRLPPPGVWMGGVAYFRNLLEALLSLPARTVEPVLQGPATDWPGALGRQPAIPGYEVPGVWSVRDLRHRLETRLLGRGRDFDRYLRRHGIRLLSHQATPGRPTRVPFLYWIPDFQHRHLARFFPPEEIAARIRKDNHWVACARKVLLSSETAREDYNRFHPEHAAKAVVLRFVAAPPAEAELPRPEAVLAKHGIHEPFFHVPNQVWAHKNHGLVLDALNVLRQQGLRPLVISTGLAGDRRDPGYCEALTAKIAAAGLGARYRFLGMIDYPEVCVLMRRAVALINPSLFEGWSTTVEEAKSLGKRLLLSDLPVHREQAPGLGLFFDPHDPAGLAERMAGVWNDQDPARDRLQMQQAQAALPGRIREFGREYERIVKAMVAQPAGNS